jgi:hypothetical protein
MVWLGRLRSGCWLVCHVSLPHSFKEHGQNGKPFTRAKLVREPLNRAARTTLQVVGHLCCFPLSLLFAAVDLALFAR